MSISIGIVDDHSIICDGIKFLIEQKTDFCVTFQAYNGLDCLAHLEKTGHLIDILLMDITMPDIDGYNLYKEIKNKYHRIKVIYLTAYEDYHTFARAMDMGVEGYFLKSAPIENIIKGIEEVFKGKFFIDRNLESYLENYFYQNRSEDTLLTERENQIMYQVVSGKANKEIAFELEIREETVKNHLSRIYRKLNVGDRTQAALYVVKNNIIKNI